MNIALILAGGIGSRMHMGSLPKQYLMYEGKPIIDYCLQVFERHSLIDKIVIVAEPTWQGFINEWLEKSKINKFVSYASPGITRQLSIYNGLKVINEFAKQSDNVIVHDAARPLVSDKIITDCMNALESFDGAMPVLPATDTFYMSENGKSITGLIDRSQLFAGQAPESFRLGKYLKAHESLTQEALEKINGSSEIAYKTGLNIALVEGDVKNIKITTQDDLTKLKMYLQSMNNK